MSELEEADPVPDHPEHPAVTRDPFVTRVARGVRDFVDGIANSSPARLAVIVFVIVDLAFAALLWLPMSAAPGKQTSVADAVFTATSAVTVTGLTTVSTADQWSLFGQVIILVAIQIGGLGTLTMTSLLALAIGRKLGLKSKLITQEALNIGRLGEVGSLLRIIVVTSISIEAALTVVLTLGFLVSGEPIHTALWHGVFYGISSFNNAGFTPHSDGLVPYDHTGLDSWLILFPICIGVFIGSLGFPVILVLREAGFRFTRWNLNAKLTLLTTGVLLVIGWLLFSSFEWDNQATIGEKPVSERIFHGFFASVMMRSGGFNLVDMTDTSPVTLLLTDALMFVGGGSASTAGGIKVTTLAVVFLAILAEARGDKSVIAFFRTIPDSVLRISISVIMMGATVVLTGSAILVGLTGRPLDHVLFEVISAYATCGLSVGVSADATDAGKYVLAIIMLIGRIGTNTVATALALRSRRRLYSYPEERPIIG
ncbi:potassium transporter Trk [Kocuria sp. WRN011]|uniref:TrkH family potassium uptake protein n=1 Tax=Kocuria sp. WRN011 TaxID=2029858 RepID=UPI000BAF3EAD|nr:potassium transporter TrkG [Kocuria sp. WRN011]PBB09831.1 potassium transporter Trk [Kocuria sp. WRN011]